MKVDITNSTAAELLGFIQKFPSGKLIVKNNRAFWEFSDTLQQPQQNYAPILQPQNSGQLPIQNQQINQPQPLNQATGANQPQNRKKNTFLEMFDTMASYF